MGIGSHRIEKQEKPIEKNEQPIKDEEIYKVPEEKLKSSIE